MSGWIYLSHVLSKDTPFYGGKGKVQIDRVRSIAAGDTSNNSELAFPAHAGTHIDAPYHFDANGATLDSYPASYWYAERLWILDVPCQPGTIIDCARLGSLLDTVPTDCDLLLLRTGAEKWRSEQTKVYTEQGPGIAPEVGHWLRTHRKLKFLGMDTISLSSFAHRDIGRESHRAFLGPNESGSPPILLIEDMALSSLTDAPQAAWVIPTLFTSADGAPVTVLARI